MMPNDPIVAEVRRAREAYAAKFGGDVDAMIADIRSREQSHRIVDRAKLLSDQESKPENSPADDTVAAT